METLERAKEAHVPVPFDLETLRPSLRRVKAEVESDEVLIRDAIDMVYFYFISCLSLIHNNITFQKVEISTDSSHNMEYLSMLAAVFLPLTLFTVSIVFCVIILTRGVIRDEHS